MRQAAIAAHPSPDLAAQDGKLKIHVATTIDSTSRPV